MLNTLVMEQAEGKNLAQRHGLGCVTLSRQTSGGRLVQLGAKCSPVCPAI